MDIPGNRQGTASQAAEKLSCEVILSEAKNLLVIGIGNMQILRRLRLLRMIVLWEFFSNLFSRAAKKPQKPGASAPEGTSDFAKCVFSRIFETGPNHFREDLCAEKTK